MNDIKEQKTTGIIYKLCCKDITVKEIYVGSTTNFRSRKYEHKHRTHKEGSKYYNMKVYKYIRDNGGWINWDMIQIEEYEYTNKRDLHQRERHFLEELKATLNIQIPSREGVEARKEYREKNPEKIKTYYTNKREEILTKMKIPRTCGCGSTIRNSDYKRHLKSKKHKVYETSLTTV